MAPDSSTLAGVALFGGSHPTRCGRDGNAMTKLSDQAKRGGGRGLGVNTETGESISPIRTCKAHRTYRERSTVFVPSGEVTADVVQQAERVFMLGPAPGSRAILAMLDSSASVYLDGHFPVVRIGDSQLTYAESWFGAGAYSPADCQRAWEWLSAGIKAFGPTATMLASPGTTGRDLWLRTVRDEGYSVVSPAVQTVIRSSAGQGRIEMLPAGAGLLPAMYEYDARLAYLGVTRELPIGEPESVDGRRYESERMSRARWLVEWTVPKGWRLPGILPVMLPAGGWYWPTVPGAYGPSWVDATELHLAVQAGWSVRIHEGMLWHETADVFRTWQDRLLRIMDRAVTELEPAGAGMIRSAVRAMILHTIGAMHGAPRKATGIGSAGAVPKGASDIRQLSDGRMIWSTSTAPAMPELVHPEWTSTIWGRARARLLDAPTGIKGQRAGLLHCRPGTVVAVRTDAIYLTEPAPWHDAPDDGKPGRYVFKGAYQGPMPWPRTGRDILTIKGRA